MQRTNFGLVAALVLCGFFSVVRAQPPSAAPAANTRPLRVNVVDAVTGERVVGAEIVLQAREAVKVITDSNGVATLDVAMNGPTPEKDTQFSFGVFDARYEPRRVEWFSDAGNVRLTVPEEYTVKLVGGTVGGGIVRDEQGAPVAGAKIVIYASGLRSRRLGRGDKLQQEYGSISVPESEGLVTDAQGRWRKEHFPTEITQISIDVIRPGGARTRFISGSMYRGPNERGGIVQVDELLRQATTFTIKDGVTILGRVQDEAGKPISGVQLRARDADSRNQPHVFLSNPDGTFELPHWDVSDVLVTAEKAGYRTKSASIAAGGDAGAAKIVLTPAKPLVLRIVDESGSPIANAELQTDPNPSPSQIVAWKGKTDANGRVEWKTAPDESVDIWIMPPPGTDYPSRQARFVADGNEHVVRVRRGADKMVRVDFRVVDAETGAPVRKFEVWRRLANQSFKIWGEPAEGGTFSQEIAVGELPNGFVPSYRLQVRAAGYTGWSSETLDFADGDQDHTIKLAKGESILASNPPSPARVGGGVDGTRNPQLMQLAAAVGRLLETGDIPAFVQASNASLDDWKKILPTGAGEKDLPLGDAPARMIERREHSIAASATHVLDLARRVGITPGAARFTIKSVESPSNASRGYQIAGRQVNVPFALALRLVLVGEPANEAGSKTLRGDYELSVGSSLQFPSGWRTEEGLRWTKFPDGLADTATQRELSLLNRATPTAFDDERTLSAMDDPALEQLGENLVELLRQRSVSAFLGKAVLSSAETVAFYSRTVGRSAAAAAEMREQLATGVSATAESLLALQSRIGIDLTDAKVTVKQVLAERPRFTQFGQIDGLRTSPLRVTFVVESSRPAKSGVPLAGNYTVSIDEAARVGDRWVVMSDKLRFQEFPKGVVADDELKHVELENYVAENRTLPPGHPAPDVSFTSLADNSVIPLSNYRGKVVILEFWATWCGPCQEPMAKLQQLVSEHPEWKDRVAIIALSLDDQAALARSHLAKNGWGKTFNVWAGEGAWEARAAKEFRVRGVPTSYVLDRGGAVLKAGHPMGLEFAEIVEEALKKPL